MIRCLIASTMLFLPIRVKGRDIGEPQWGKLEILENGKWKEYIPDEWRP